MWWGGAFVWSAFSPFHFRHFYLKFVVSVSKQMWEKWCSASQSPKILLTSHRPGRGIEGRGSRGEYCSLKGTDFFTVFLQRGLFREGYLHVPTPKEQSHLSFLSLVPAHPAGSLKAHFRVLNKVGPAVFLLSTALTRQHPWCTFPSSDFQLFSCGVTGLSPAWGTVALLGRSSLFQWEVLYDHSIDSS